MGVRTRGLDIKAGAAKLKADRAARARGGARRRPLESAPGHRPRHAVVAHYPGRAARRNAMARCLLLRAAGRAGRSICGRRPSPAASVGTQSSGCGALGVRDRRRCRTAGTISSTTCVWRGTQQGVTSLSVGRSGGVPVDQAAYRDGYIAGWRWVRGPDAHSVLVPPCTAPIETGMYSVGFSGGVRDALGQRRSASGQQGLFAR